MSLDKSIDKISEFRLNCEERRTEKPVQYASGDSKAHDKFDASIEEICNEFKASLTNNEIAELKLPSGKLCEEAESGKCCPNDDSGCYVNSETSSNSAENSDNNAKTNLIINYLPPSITQDDVKAMFTSCGNIESCKLIREKFSNESLGYAFVKYYNQEDAEKAIASFNGMKIQKKFIKVSFARPSSDEIKGANLYICNVPREMKQVELEDLFGKYGKIITARILYDTKTGLSRGIAFVRFDKKSQADSAIQQLNGHQLPCHYLKGYLNDPLIVKYANTPPVPKNCDSASFYLKHVNDFNNSNETLFNRPKVAKNLSTPIRRHSFDYFSESTRSQIKKLQPKGWIISVTNLCRFVEEYQLWQLIGPFGAVQSVFIVRDVQTGICKGFAFVTMNNYEEALFAIKTLNGCELNGENIQLTLKLPSAQLMKEIEPIGPTSPPTNNTTIKTPSMLKKQRISQSFIKDISRLENIIARRNKKANADNSF